MIEEFVLVCQRLGSRATATWGSEVAIDDLSTSRMSIPYPSWLLLIHLRIGQLLLLLGGKRTLQLAQSCICTTRIGRWLGGLRG